MSKLAWLAAILMILSPVQAQDIVGLEDCAQAKGPDKKAGCLQSNVEYLHRLIRKNEAAAQTKFRDDAAKLTAATTKLGDLQSEIDRLKAAVDRLEKAASPK